MKNLKEDIIAYRLKRARETFEDAEILADHGKWNSSINRLYYACYYAVTALQLKHGLKTSTHSGVKTVFSESFIKPQIISPELGKIYAQLFTFRQKGDYSDFFDFNGERVLPYFEPVKKLIDIIETLITQD
ncbi:MAG: HEPN domain protein [Proteiniphilum acetatigenes]|jgi:uncharacterized protein (UPF0332 family)|uniref:HEPN domain protein n=1 Tax=Proteiniphilum acetatigenes TaxID=294710 RepID=A0A101HG78_9BACT|nr:MAG: HEPN domain protein [Proteiniphilum acetatigenes]